MLGVLVQANHGSRHDLTIAGVPVGRELKGFAPRFTFGEPPPGAGSIIVIVATDAPLLPHQLTRLAKRVPLGIGRVGGNGENSSGDIFLAFSTANPGASDRDHMRDLTMLPNDVINQLFYATIEATEEAILNVLVAGETTTGINNNMVPGLPKDEVMRILKEYNRAPKN